MRISTSQIHQQGLNGIIDRQTAAARTQAEIATGRRILAPSDDPSGAKTVLDLNQVISTNQQYQRNGDQAQARISMIEASLSGGENFLQRARELLIRANNDTLDAAQRIAIAEELREIHEGVLGLANVKDANDEYLFAGYQSDTLPFSDNGSGSIVYNGDQGQKQIQIGPSRLVITSESGADVFVNIPGVGQDVFAILDTAITDLQANTPNAASIDDIDAALNSLTTARARAGTRLNAIENQQSVNEDFALQAKTLLSNTEDVDIAEAITRLNLQLTGLEAAQQSYAKIQGLSLFNYI